MEDETFQRRMVRAAQDARKAATPAEKALWAMVRGHRCGGFYFRRQTILASFRVDFYCDAVRLSIELDGVIHNEPHIQKRDGERQALLEQEYGLHFLRLSNEDVLKRPQETRRLILQFAQSLTR